LENGKIYVSIASYRDPYLQSTIDSLFCEADNPDNITVGCFIHALEKEFETLKLERVYDEKVKYEIEIPGQIFSVTECRNRCLKWLDDSYDYVLQIDSHSRFDQGWDTKLIKMLKSTNDNKAILSGALPVFDILEDGTEIKKQQNYPVSFIMHSDTTKENLLHSYDLSPRGQILTTLPNKEYAIDWYLAGHFMFSLSEYFKKIPQPDWVLFWGEEVLNGVRAFTAGYNVYIPKNVPIYHLYSDRIKRPRLSQDFPKEYFPKRDYTTNRIIDILIGKDIKKDDIFYERSMSDFYIHVGYNLGEFFDFWRKWRKELIDVGRNV
jgi:hypothetical protein